MTNNSDINDRGPAEPAPEVEPIEVAAQVEPLNSDNIRTKILEQFAHFQPHLQAYHDYSQRMAALSVEYHNSRLAETLGVKIDDEVLLTTLDARQTPKTLDTQLAQIEKLPGTKIKRIVFDRTKATYYLFI